MIFLLLFFHEILLSTVKLCPSLVIKIFLETNSQGTVGLKIICKNDNLSVRVATTVW